MAQLTDEEKAALVASGEEPEKTLPEQSGTPEEEPSHDDGTVEPEKPAETSEESDKPTFTKQFSNLKGETWDEYGTELEKAYQNSFTEALRLKKELDDARRVIANLPAIQQADKQDPAPATTAPADIPAELQYAKTLMQRDMKTSFDKFSEEYPQVKDEASFTKFRDAATPVGQAFLAVEGREPTYDELFPKIAAILGWQPVEVEGKQDQALKETLTQGHTASGQTRAPSRGPRVSNAQVDAYLRMFPSKSRPDAVKELEEAIS